MKKYFILLLAIICKLSFAQNADTITLEFCQQKALENYPLIIQKDLINKSGELKMSNLAKAYMPQLSLNGQATYQSAVTEIPINIPNLEIPSLYKDMYKATLDVTQIIYDGGLTSRQKKLVTISLESDLQGLVT